MAASHPQKLAKATNCRGLNDNRRSRSEIKRALGYLHLDRPISFVGSAGHLTFQCRLLPRVVNDHRHFWRSRAEWFTTTLHRSLHPLWASSDLKLELRANPIALFQPIERGVVGGLACPVGTTPHGGLAKCLTGSACRTLHHFRRAKRARARFSAIGSGN